ncbi:cell division transport system permease protein [Roseiarcus fermentans]|uniref:Cell division transport system permease protein n=1 Tax=Roseiarcus fermentans TaxID=1473586 RepID=A0A366FPA6_9HYPH|nr:ABC transporter permease [Roseiarcus fermentans]RBP16387.1 cell division transport system permease protein [Roseiarcus fermentans]
MTEPGDDGAAPIAPSSEAAVARGAPLIPRDSISGSALVVVVAIMTFLACLTAGGALLVAQASQAWKTDVLSDLTIQVKPGPDDDVDRVVERVVAIAVRQAGSGAVHAYSADDSKKLLQPWLGDNIDLALLPVPRIVVVRLANDADIAALRTSLAREAPQADLDDHRVWASRISVMAGAIVSLALAIFLLVIVAMATAIGFATRGAVAENREIVEVLHFVGASDRFVANQFHGHFQRLGFQGAAIGGGAAIAFFLAAAGLSRWSANSPGGAELAALFGSFALGPGGYFGLLLVAGVVTLLTGILSRRIVVRHLRALQ